MQSLSQFKAAEVSVLVLVMALKRSLNTELSMPVN